MIGRIVEIADDNRHLSLQRGFMVVTDTGRERKEIGQVPIDDIAAIIANAHGMSYTNNLLVALAERGAPFVLCGANHNPAGMLIGVDGNYNQARRFDAQIAASKPTHKRMWAEIVRSKVAQQAAVIEATGGNPTPLTTMLNKIKSGDPDNIEAQAARLYWTQLMGNDFRRDQNAGGINSLLNYGYTILRACTARSVIAAGLHPTISLFHSNANNPMRLVDDLMEPFRPMADLKVWQLAQKDETELQPNTKRALVHVMYDDMQTDAGATPVMTCIQRLATSLVQIYLGERNNLDTPLPSLPIDLASHHIND
jgi:CRISPR-associated protein Cas1